jgi:hypothetical protein
MKSLRRSDVCCSIDAMEEWVDVQEREGIFCSFIADGPEEILARRLTMPRQLLLSTFLIWTPVRGRELESGMLGFG